MKAMPGLCLKRYSQHTDVWIDKDGVSRCRRCHVPWVPGVKTAPKTSARDRINRRAAVREAFKAKQPPKPTHNPACPHPPPFQDPMEAHRVAQECMATGIEQRECPVCRDWVWESLFNPPQEATAPLASANPSDFDPKND